MAMAVQKLYPDAKVTIGPWIENGFYYDFDMEPLTDKDLKRIKKEMVRRLVVGCCYCPFLFLCVLWIVIAVIICISYAFWVQYLFLESSVGSHHWSKFTTD